jgi:large subunit ribosomal protein L9
MKIILNKDVYNLGEEGDVCDVARGYARNYLFPKDLALAYTKQNIARIENRRTAIEKRKEEKRQNSLSLKDRLEGKEIVIRMNAGQGGKLFGSVTNAMIADELQKEGVEVERKKIEVASHQIKMVGTYPVRVKLYENNDAQLKIKVVSQSESQEPVEKTEEKADRKKAGIAVEEPAAEEAAQVAGTADEAEVEAASAEEAAEASAEDSASEEALVSPEAAAAEAAVEAEIKAESEEDKEKAKE